MPKHGDTEWSAAEVNDLPDSAFLFVSPGGENDEGGKTTPRSLRHFPYRNKAGEVDLPHLRNALGRIPQSDVPAEEKAKLTERAQRLLESENKDSRDVERVYRLDLSSGQVGTRKRTPQGGLIADANLTRVGVFPYRTESGGVRRELRSPDEVFAPASLATYAHAPVTVDHPGKVGPDNWKVHAVGEVGDAAAIRRNGDFLAGQLHIHHGDAMERAEGGELREISCGYHCDLDPTPGVYMGQPYDAVQRNIRINHVAIGPAGWGRMGPETKMHLDSGAAVSGEHGATTSPIPAELAQRADAASTEATELGSAESHEAAAAAHQAAAAAYLVLDAGASAAAHLYRAARHLTLATVALTEDADKSTSHFSREKFGGGEKGEAAAHEALLAHEKTLVPGSVVRVYRGGGAGTIGHIEARKAEGARTIAVHDPSLGISRTIETRNVEHVTPSDKMSTAEHKAAGEAHLAGAKLASSEKAAAEHKEKAAEHAAAAGGEWDEAKHPRDENGKFDSLTADRGPDPDMVSAAARVASNLAATKRVAVIGQPSGSLKSPSSEGSGHSEEHEKLAGLAHLKAAGVRKTAAEKAMRKGDERTAQLHEREGAMHMSAAGDHAKNAGKSWPADQPQPSASGVLDAARYVHSDRGDSRTEHASMTPEEKVALEKAQADAAKAQADLDKARADAAAATTAADKASAQSRADKAEIETLKAEKRVLEAQVARQTSDGKSAERKAAEEKAFIKATEELIAVRADARSVFATVDDPTGAQWSADGKSADAIRREVLAHLDPAFKADAARYDSEFGEAQARAMVTRIYDITMTRERAAAKARMDADDVARAARRDADGEGDEDEGGDEDGPMDAEAERKKMIKRKRDAWKAKKDGMPAAAKR